MSDATARSPANARRRRRLLLEVGSWVLLTILAFIVSVMTGFMLLVELPFTALFGWIGCIAKVLPLVRPSSAAVSLFIAVVVLLLTAAHRLLAQLGARLTPPRSWRLRDTVASLTVCVALFIAMVAATGGVLRPGGWGSGAHDPIVEVRRWPRMDPFRIRDLWSVRMSIQWPPENLRRSDSRIPLKAVPVGHPTLHAVPLDIGDGESAASVLLFLRDPGDLEDRGGLLCQSSAMHGPDIALSSAEVRARLADLRRRASR